MLCITMGACYSYCGICPNAWNCVGLCHGIHGILLKGENTCCGTKTSCSESLWLSLVRWPEGTSFLIWKVLHSCWTSRASPLRRLRLLFLVFNGGCLFHSVCGNLEPQSVRFGKVLTVVQKAVPCCPRKNVILQFEVSYQNQGGRIHCVEVYKWCPVVAPCNH